MAVRGEVEPNEVSMKIQMTMFVALALAASLGGCGTRGPQSATVQVPSPEVKDAVFYDEKNHDYAFISGEYFKMSSDNRLDVVASLDGSTWKPARTVFASSSTEYKARLPFDASYPKVWVRVFGMNGEYSEPFLVHF